MNDPSPAPAVIRRLDYTPPAWLVPEIALDFDLSLDATKVRARLSVARQTPGAPLRLNGDGLGMAG
ncbi:hypothetical protein, partial [Salmonella enterica]|uniref:hypothetical protein n=1 Tax=Salmonella enterica TaxID=28901 RepID=UPI003D2AAB8C